MRGVCVALALALVAQPGCSHRTNELTTHHTSIGGVTRTWYEFRPAHLAARPTPVLLLFHGYRSNPVDLLAGTRFGDAATRAGFIVAAPQGIDAGWNAGSCCGTTTADDVSFAAAIVSDLVRRHAAQADHVYAAGFSNGAMLAYRLGCQLAGVFAGVAVVEGTMTAPCPDHPPLDLLVIHQLGDPIVPYAGTQSPSAGLNAQTFPSVASSIATWEQSESCVVHTALTPPGPADLVHRALHVCPGGARVELELLPGGAHIWPRIGFDATAEITAFLGL
jgi:polyhydroxybutyrate depolymerase